MNKGQFLTHLAGLRGAAIVAVVLFHLNGHVWTHGYLGVDVFLVITGYLLFRSQAAKEKTDTLQESAKYLWRRAQRVVPPMLVVILMSLLLGICFMWWKDELMQARLGISACLAKANCFLQREFEDYFAADTAYIPLLHLWYLSVTLQIYAMWAVGSQLLQRLPKRWALCAVVALGLASLAYHYEHSLYEWLRLHGMPTWESSGAVSYYETLPRVWEVLAGGLALALPSLRTRRCWATVASAVGLLCILAPTFGPMLPQLEFLADLPCTLIVVAGSVLTLRYMPEGKLNALLSNKLLLFLGGISFSLYLVHMPIIVYTRICMYGMPSVGVWGVMLGVSLVAAWLFHHAVEKRRMAWWLVVALWVVTFLVCRTGRKTDGFSAYFPAMTQCSLRVIPYDSWREYSGEALQTCWSPEFDPPFFGVYLYMDVEIPNPQPKLLAMGAPAAEPSVLLVGDSHGAHLYAGLDAVLREEGVGGVYFSSVIIPFHDWEEFMYDVYKTNPAKERAFMKWLAAHPQITHVVIGQRWKNRLAHYPEKQEERLREFLTELRSLGKQVILVAPTPEFTEGGAKFYIKASPDTPGQELSREDYLHMQKGVLAVLEKMEREGLCTCLYIHRTLAEGEGFPSTLGDVSLLYDGLHMNAELSKWFMQRLAPQLRTALKRSQPTAAPPHPAPAAE